MNEDVAIYYSKDKVIYDGLGECTICRERNVLTDTTGCEKCNPKSHD